MDKKDNLVERQERIRKVFLELFFIDWDGYSFLNVAGLADEIAIDRRTLRDFLAGERKICFRTYVKLEQFVARLQRKVSRDI